ncbi:MAG: radical SAM protein [Candidatus Thermoplasmatota archaeon]|nr:radical SAM protein [Candidatus Thermoplasmatota archaeon]
MLTTLKDWVPSILFLETTRACEYTCLHCRAESQPNPSDGELTVEELKSIVDEIVEFDGERPEIVITGGNLMLKPGIRDLISYISSKGLKFSLSPAASLLVDYDFINFAANAGLSSISLSLDFPTDNGAGNLRDPRHSIDLIRQISEMAIKSGIRVQINTTVYEGNVNELPGILKIIKSMGISTWEVFFLIRTGRAIGLNDLGPKEYMQVNSWLADLSRYGMNVRTVEGPVFRAIKAIRSISPEILEGPLYDKLSEETYRLLGMKVEDRKPDLPTSGQRSQFRGTLFIGSNGNVYPSGLLTYLAGNIRNVKLKEIISNHTDLLDWKNSGSIKGKCGNCGFLRICGGSRARAYTYEGDPFASDPMCLFFDPRST